MSKYKKHHHHNASDQAKREQFKRPAHGRISPTVLVASMCVVFAVVLAYLVFSGSRVSAEPITEIAGSGTDVSLPVSTFADGKAKFYRYTTAAGRQLRFFVMRSADGAIRAAFDACVVCWDQRKGYHQEGDDMVCNNCRRHFRSTAINVVQGGCNPAPLDRTLAGDQVTFSASALASGAALF